MIVSGAIAASLVLLLMGVGLIFARVWRGSMRPRTAVGPVFALFLVAVLTPVYALAEPSGASDVIGPLTLASLWAAGCALLVFAGLRMFRRHLARELVQPGRPNSER